MKNNMRLISLLLLLFFPLVGELSGSDDWALDALSRGNTRPKIDVLDNTQKKLPMVNIALMAIFRDEARFLKEWIEYHRLIGVERFYLSNHLSKDNYLEILQPYIDQGIVDLRNETSDSDLFLTWNKIQLNAYNVSLTKAREETKWLIVIDTDEFVVPKKGSLTSILKKAENYGGIAINWQVFGTSHVPKIPEDKLMIESLLLKAPKNFNENHFFKMIVQPKHVGRFVTPHYCHFSSSYYGVDMGGNGIKGNFSHKVHNDEIQINHYWTRDEDFFIHVKMARKKKMGPWFNIMESNVDQLNQEVDDSILPYVPALRTRMGL